MSTTNVPTPQETQDEKKALGAAAYRHYVGILNNMSDVNAWTGLALALHSMGQTRELQAVLARHALRKLPYDSYIGVMAIAAFKYHPVAMTEWLRLMSKAPALTAKQKEMLNLMSKEMKQVLDHLNQNEQALANEFSTGLEAISNQPIGLDLLLDKSLDEAISYVEGFLSHETLSIAAVRELGFFPSPRSEKLLRRMCRDEQTNPKIQTQAVLSLNWLGAEGNVKLVKFGETHLISLSQPGMPVNMALPKPLLRVYRRMQAWFALQTGLITQEQYQATDLEELPENVTGSLPSHILSVGEILLREAFLHYFPVFPAMEDQHVWAQAVLGLLQELEASDGSEWAYPAPETSPAIQAAREWLLQANPSLMDDDGEEAGASALTETTAPEA